MLSNKTTLERAFELAATGVPTGLPDLRKQLRAEGYDVTKLQGRSLTKQIRKTLEQAKASRRDT